MTTRSLTNVETFGKIGDRQRVGMKKCSCMFFLERTSNWEGELGEGMTDGRCLGVLPHGGVCIASHRIVSTPDALSPLPRGGKLASTDLKLRRLQDEQHRNREVQSSPMIILGECLSARLSTRDVGWSTGTPQEPRTEYRVSLVNYQRDEVERRGDDESGQIEAICHLKEGGAKRRS